MHNISTSPAPKERFFDSLIHILPNGQIVLSWVEIYQQLLFSFLNDKNLSFSFLSLNRAKTSYSELLLFFLDFFVFTKLLFLGDLITIPFARGDVTVMVVSKSYPKDISIAFPFPLSWWVLGEGEWEVSLSKVEE